MVRLSTGFRDLILGTDSFKGIFDTGVIFLFSGTQPSSADNAVSGTHLGTITVDGGAFAFGTAANGLVFDPPVEGLVSKAAADIWRFTGLEDGTVGWGRLMANAPDDLAASAILPRIDFSVGRTGADLNLSSTTIITGQSGTIDTFGYRIPAQ